jgi:hypothetical protein
MRNMGLELNDCRRVHALCVHAEKPDEKFGNYLKVLGAITLQSYLITHQSAIKFVAAQ